jgi:hypothetical protein
MKNSAVKTKEEKEQDELLLLCKNEWIAKLMSCFVPSITTYFTTLGKRIYQKCVECQQTAEHPKLFQQSLANVAKWTQQEKENESNSIQKKCEYIQDVLSMCHVIELKILFAAHTGPSLPLPTKIDLEVPRLVDFVHLVYLGCARKFYSSVHLFVAHPQLTLTQQEKQEKIANLIRQCIFQCVRDSMPYEKIIEALFQEQQAEDEKLSEEKEEDEEPPVTATTVLPGILAPPTDLFLQDVQLPPSAPAIAPVVLFRGGGGEKKTEEEGDFPQFSVKAVDSSLPPVEFDDF